MPEQFEKLTPKEELEKIKPTPVEKKKPIELTKEEDEYFIDLLKKPKKQKEKEIWNKPLNYISNTKKNTKL